MKNSSIFRLGVLLYIAGVVATIYIGAAMYRQADFVEEFYPFPLVAATVLSLLFCAIFAGRVVYPLFQLYQYKLFWQKEWGNLCEADYQNKLAKAQSVRNVFVCTLYLSCWAIYPLLLFGAAYLCASRYVLNLYPRTEDFLKR